MLNQQFPIKISHPFRMMLLSQMILSMLIKVLQIFATSLNKLNLLSKVNQQVEKVFNQHHPSIKEKKVLIQTTHVRTKISRFNLLKVIPPRFHLKQHRKNPWEHQLNLQNFGKCIRNSGKSSKQLEVNQMNNKQQLQELKSTLVV